jgi:hypothetical protein
MILRQGLKVFVSAVMGLVGLRFHRLVIIVLSTEMIALTSQDLWALIRAF